ncbi:hypothetical protein BsIDN1_64830 [Bacillus safensis]|uniref:Uncharacterized protein n=1 Tax=Bacillus safensis TaxID=561879 RepID=A0A5S9MJA6_BACIA|nr:hypothetical protein BsIDN1_64830 [Bacillus safensis]
MAALREQVASLSVLIASKVIEKELDEQAQEKLIQEYLKEAGERKPMSVTIVSKRYASALLTSFLLLRQ